MHLPAHLMVGWLVGHRLESPRDRRLVAWAGVIPDVDALSLLFGLEAYGKWHHVLAHGFVAAALTALLVGAAARDRARTVGLALVSFHLHLVCDLLGSGPQWPIVYAYPFSEYEYFTPYGWQLASWQNTSIAIVLLLAVGWVALRRRRTFAECFLPLRVDQRVADTLIQRFGARAPERS